MADLISRIDDLLGEGKAPDRTAATAKAQGAKPLTDLNDALNQVEYLATEAVRYVIGLDQQVVDKAQLYQTIVNMLSSTAETLQDTAQMAKNQRPLEK